MQEPNNTIGASETESGRLLVTFKPIMALKSRNELLKSLGARVAERSEDNESVIVEVPVNDTDRVLGILRGAPGVHSASRILHGSRPGSDDSER